MKRWVALACGILLVPTGAAADVAVHYYDPHPIDADSGGGFCYERGRHRHEYRPAQEIRHLYRDCGGAYCFVGDPVPFGYGGEVAAYDGHHAIALVPQWTYCYLVGFHYHAFLPPPELLAFYAFWNGMWTWRGPWVRVYREERPRYERKTPTYERIPAYRATAARAVPYYSAAWRARLSRSPAVLRLPGLWTGGAPRLLARTGPAVVAPVLRARALPMRPHRRVGR